MASPSSHHDPHRHDALPLQAPGDAAETVKRPREEDAIDWIIEQWLKVAGLVAGWFVDPDLPQFEVARGVVGIVLVAIIVIVVGLVWPAQWRRGGGSSP